MSNTPLLKRLASNDPVPVPNPAQAFNALDGRAAQSPVMNRQLAELRKTQDDLDREARRFDIPPVDTLVGYCIQGFAKAKQFKIANGTQHKQFEALRNYVGEYAPEDLPKNGGPGTAKWWPLTSMIVHRMHAFLRDTLADSRERPRYDFESTTIPEVPGFMIESVTALLEEEIVALVQQGLIETDREAVELIESYGERLFRRVQDAADFSLRKTKRAVDDKLDQSNYREVFDEALLTGCIYGTGLKFGPERIIQLRPGYESDDSDFDRANPETAPTWKYRKTWNWRSLDPIHFFPSPCSTNGVDGEAWYYVDKMSRHDLFLARSCPGYLADNIEHVLREDCAPYQQWTSNVWAEGAASLKEQRSNRQNDDRIDVLWRFGYLPGRLLIQMGYEQIDGKTIVPFGEYDVQIKLVGRTPIQIICNTDPQGCRGLHKFNLFKTPGAFWADGVYDRAASQQAMVNAAFRSISWNMGYSAAPMYEFNEAVMKAGYKLQDIIPGMMIPKDTADTGLSGNVLTIHGTETNVGSFMALLRECVEQTELLLGLPRFLTGATSASGAARTATGLQQLQNNAFINVKSLIVNIDQGLTQSAMSKMYRLCLSLNEDPDLASDAQVVTLGASAMLSRTVNRDNLFGQLGALLPYIQSGFLPVPFVDELLRELAQHMGLDARLLPDRELDQAEQLAQIQALAQAGGINGGVGAAAQGTGSAGADLTAQQQGGQAGGLASQ